MTRSEYLQSPALHALRGNALPHARLNASAVRDIRRNVPGWTAKQWAVELGVHLRTIEKVRHYETWRHVR